KTEPQAASAARTPEDHQRWSFLLHRSPQSPSSPELDDSSPIAFRGSSGSQLFELVHCLAFGSNFQAQFPAGFGFTVTRLRHRCRAAHFAEQQNFNLEFAAGVCHLQQVAYADLARTLDRLSIANDSGQVTGTGR